MISFFKKLGKNLLFQVLCTLIVGFFIAPYISIGRVSFFYSISCSIKDILSFFLPIIIFSYLSASIISYENCASKIVLGIFLGIILSIFLALSFSYGIGKLFFTPTFLATSAISTVSIDHSLVNVKQLWSFPLKGFPTDSAMIISLLTAFGFNFLRSSYISRLRHSHYHKMEGMLKTSKGTLIKGIFSLGIFASDIQLEFFKRGILKLKSYSEGILLKFFVPLIPLYVFGFILKLSAETTSNSFLKEFSCVFLFNGLCIFIFLCFSFFIAANFKISQSWIYFKNMLPASLTGFSTMSSVATMPITIQSVEKNLLHDPYFAKLVIPITVNVHAIGDVINISLSGLALLLISSLEMPSFETYAYFAFYACIAQFSCVSIPGGGIIVMTGILQTYLGLNAESLMLLTSIYFLLEPFLTAANVTYNGAFTVILRKVLRSCYKPNDATQGIKELSRKDSN